ncbi:MAG TPA: glycosyl hydrolase 53 family protein [Chitinophagaceae bacterium]|nr:glycosyl hydrolase 53 family protein [Chitinophagaceae bacterium]
MRLLNKNTLLLFYAALAISAILFVNCNRQTTGSSRSSTKYYSWEEFSMGVDLSYVNQVQDYGGKFKDEGREKDPFRIFRDHGANTVRVRLWHNPQWQAALNNGRLYNDIYDVAKTIKRAKAAGMAVNLDIHYSDTWADPAHQEKPAAWQNISFEALKDSVYQYTLRVLLYLREQDLVPEIVQVGNENNNGMLFPDGKVINNNWVPFTSLLKSGIKAVRDFSANSVIKPKIILHVAQLQHAPRWVDSVIRGGGVNDFDIIGLSHYPKWSTVKSMEELSTVIRSLITTWKKKVMIVETAYPWTGLNADNYTNIISAADQFANYTISPEGQQQFLRDLTQHVIDGGGSGVMYWEPAWISSGLRDRWGQGSSWENNALFDFNGNVLPAMDFMRYRYKF